MLSSIAEKIWGNQCFDDDADSPGKSTSAGDDEDLPDSSDVNDLSCSLWEVEGTDAKEVLQCASVSWEDLCLVLEGPAAGGSVRREFRYCDVVHFHQHQEEIFQWIIRKGPEDVEEFGVVLPSAAHGRAFNRWIRPKLRESAEEICREAVEFKEYDRETKEWIVREENAVLSVLQRKDCEAYLVVAEGGGGGEEGEIVLSEVGISHEEYIFPQPAEMQLTWWGPGHEGSEGSRRMYGGRFLCEDASAQIVFETVERVLREHSGQKQGGGDEGYSEEAFVMSNAEREEEEKLVWMDAEEIRPEDVVCRDSTRSIATKAPGSKVHKLMYVGSDRTFVVRGAAGRGDGGAEMQVLKFNVEGTEEVVASVDAEKLRFSGEDICPSKALLHDSERKMLMMDESDSQKVFLMDVEKEKVVQAWTAGEGVGIQNLLPKAKGSESTSEPTFLATNANSIFTMDTRLKGIPAEGGGGGKSGAGVAKTSGLSYVSNVQFTCGATDNKGHVLLGSKGGDLRLYDGETNKEGKLKRAKTHLPGLGDPLMHVSVTKDGGWILGTCAKYLVLFPVKLTSSGKTGFVSALGKAKPPPIMLKLSMEDMLQYSLQDVNFAKAEFNEEETAIVTSTGNLAIVWDFAKVVEGGVKGAGAGAYTVRAVDDYIKDVDFVRGISGQENIVMATPCNVTTKAIMKVGS